MLEANIELGLAAWKKHLSEQTRFIDSPCSTKVAYDAWLATAAAARLAEAAPSDRSLALPAATVSAAPPLALPAPEDVNGLITLDVSTGEAVLLERLGPVVVNTDGTLSRITNWDTMTEGERATAKRLIAKRNGTQPRASLQQPVSSSRHGATRRRTHGVPA